MTKKGKESKEAATSNEYSIRIVDAEIAKNKKLYVTLPVTLPRLPPPSQEPQLWFDFGKQWHPIGIFGADGKLIISKNSLQMEISNTPIDKGDFKPTRHAVTATATKGIYWFSMVSAHVGGYMSYKFTSSGADSLVHRAEIIEDKVSESARLRAESIDATVPKIQSTPGSGRGRQTAESAADTTKETESHDTNTEKGKRSRSASIVKPEEVKAKRSAASSSDSSSSSSSMMERPSSELSGNGPRLSHKHRVERSTGNYFPDDTTAIKDGKLTPPSLVRVRGPILEIALSPSLTIALLDDRARVDSGIIGPINTENSKGSNKSQSQSMIAVTVTELLNKIQLRAKHNIAECDVLLLRIRQLFECLFESSILYSSERSSMKLQLDAIKSQKSNFADSFGGIYLLRLLVLIVTGADSIYPHSAEHSSESLGSPSSNKNSGNTSIKEIVGNDVIVDTGDRDQSHVRTSALASPTAASHSSKSRRSALISKHHKIEFYKFQEVIDCALRELDESAHMIF